MNGRTQTSQTGKRTTAPRQTPSMGEALFGIPQDRQRTTRSPFAGSAIWRGTGSRKPTSTLRGMAIAISEEGSSG
jgi:hypothetical protein